MPALFLDAGNLFSDQNFTANQLPADVITKNKWVVKGYGEFHQTAANISFNDLPYLASLLSNEGYEERVKELPFINRLISANVRPLDSQLHAPGPYVIQNIKLMRGAAGKELRIGIVGFTEPGPTGSNVIAGFQIDDPRAAAKRILPELKQKADVIVALAYMPQEKAQQLASENPEIDTIIGAYKTTTQEQPQHFGRATITYAFDQTKALGELRYYVKGDGSIENQVNRYIDLDAGIPDDLAAQQLVADAHTEFTNQQSSNAQLANTSTTLSANSPYVGSQACAACHQAEFDKWAQSGHAKAMATLERKGQQFDNDCVKCHTVGFGQSGGFQSLMTTPQLANVQCESCHGPGRQHVNAPAKGYGFMPTPVGCVQCHTKSNSPDFNFETYWPKVKH